MQLRVTKAAIQPSCFRCNWWIHSICQNIYGNKFVILASWRLRHLFKKRCFQLQLLCVDHRPVHRSLIHSYGSRDHARICYWLERYEELATNLMGYILWTNRPTWRNPDFPVWCIQRIRNSIYLCRISDLRRPLRPREKHWVNWHAHPSLRYWYLDDDFYWVPEHFLNNCARGYEWNFPWGGH